MCWFYRPQTKFGEGNVFTPVCHSVHRWVCVQGAPARGSICPGGVSVRETPPTRYIAGGTQPTGIHSCEPYFRELPVYWNHPDTTYGLVHPYPSATDRITGTMVLWLESEFGTESTSSQLYPWVTTSFKMFWVIIFHQCKKRPSYPSKYRPKMIHLSMVKSDNSDKLSFWFWNKMFPINTMLKILQAQLIHRNS